MDNETLNDCYMKQLTSLSYHCVIKKWCIYEYIFYVHTHTQTHMQVIIIDGKYSHKFEGDYI